jgi:hypothetical protein
MLRRILGGLLHQAFCPTNLPNKEEKRELTWLRPDLSWKAISLTTPFLMLVGEIEIVASVGKKRGCDRLYFT